MEVRTFFFSPRCISPLSLTYPPTIPLLTQSSVSGFFVLQVADGARVLLQSTSQVYLSHNVFQLSCRNVMQMHLKIEIDAAVLLSMLEG